MGIFVFVTCATGWINRFVLPIGMAVCTGSFAMFPLQRKPAHRIVIEEGMSSRKTSSLVTAVTIKFFKLTIMRILMAAITPSTVRLPLLPAMAI